MGKQAAGRRRASGNGLRPAHGGLSRDARGFVTGRILEALIEHHHDVAPERHLHVDGRFRSEHVRIAVEVRAEQHAIGGDLAQAAEAEYLKSSGIGQDGPWPGHELMEAAQPADGFVPRAQKEMISVAEDDLGVQIIDEVAREEAFDGGLRADGHEDRGLDDAVRGVKEARAGVGVRAGGLELEAEHRTLL